MTVLVVIGFFAILIVGLALVGSGRDRRHRNARQHGAQYSSYGTAYTGGGIVGGTFGGSFSDGGGGGGDCGGGGGGGSC